MQKYGTVENISIGSRDYLEAPLQVRLVSGYDFWLFSRTWTYSSIHLGRGEFNAVNVQQRGWRWEHCTQESRRLEIRTPCERCGLKERDGRPTEFLCAWEGCGESMVGPPCDERS